MKSANRRRKGSRRKKAKGRRRKRRRRKQRRKRRRKARPGKRLVKASGGGVGGGKTLQEERTFLGTLLDHLNGSRPAGGGGGSGRCGCPVVDWPVCSADGRDHTNLCELKCLGRELGCLGKCPCGSAVDLEKVQKQEIIEDSTVCSIQTIFPEKVTSGEACSCSDEYAPVCCADGRTHRNPCAASCAGAAIKCVGKCPCEGSSKEEADEGAVAFR